MQAARGGWAGQAFALATSSDSGAKKSRIRRSKEERKTMVESFIQKYQKSNDGSFPSLNLTHKEVGGSFYKVREIVREIIQENRVLAPPKVSLEEEHSHSGFLEQHPLGSISIEPQSDLSEADRVHKETQILPDNSQIKTEEENIPINNYQGSSMKEVNGVEVLEEIPHSDKPLIANADNQDNKNDGTLMSNQEFSGAHNKNVDKTEEFEQRIYQESAVMEIVDKESCGAQDLEALKSQMNSNVVVETFPLRPIPKTIQDIDGESGKVQEAIKHDEKMFIESSSGFVSKKHEEKLPDSAVEVNLESPSLESSTDSSASKPVAVLESKDSLPDSIKANSSAESLICEKSTEIGRKSTDQNNGSLPQENNPVLDRINLQTWEVASKKSTRPESNPLMAIVKAFISSFVKFWTE